MIDIYIREIDDVKGDLFHKADTIEEVKDTISFIEKSDIYDEEGHEYKFDGYAIINGKDHNKYVEIIVEKV